MVIVSEALALPAPMLLVAFVIAMPQSPTACAPSATLNTHGRPASMNPLLMLNTPLTKVTWPAQNVAPIPTRLTPLSGVDVKAKSVASTRPSGVVDHDAKRSRATDHNRGFRELKRDSWHRAGQDFEPITSWLARPE